MATNTKAPSERRPLPFQFANLLSAGAALVSAVCFASRKLDELLTTTLGGNVAAEDATIALAADPGVGALLTVNPGGLTEEEFKVSAVSGEGPYTCTIVPTAEFAHTSGDSVAYEPGASDRIFVDPTPAPVDTDVIPEVWNGADGQTYRLSCLATCDNGEVLELEVDLVVSELAPVGTTVKQPGETRDFAFELAALLDGETLDDAAVFVSRVASGSTTLAALASIGDTTVSLTANPGIGALLTLNPAGPNREVLKVSGISGTGPFTATVNPTVEFGHSNGETVTYEPGATGRLLVSPTPTILGSAAIVRGRKGASGQQYRATMLGYNADDSVIVQLSGFISTPEL
jgi:hypothetical protein